MRYTSHGPPIFTVKGELLQMQDKQIVLCHHQTDGRYLRSKELKGKQAGPKAFMIIGDASTEVMVAFTVRLCQKDDDIRKKSSPEFTQYTTTRY